MRYAKWQSLRWGGYQSMIKHLSVSSLNFFLAYPEAWYLKYIIGVKDAVKSDSLLFGSAVHEGVANIILNKPYINDVWEIVKNEGTQIDDVDVESTYAHIMRVLKTYEKDGPYFSPLIVEELKTVTLHHPFTGEPLDIPFVVKMDLITEDKMVVDHKTTKSEMKQQGWQYKNQGVAYWMAYKELFGEKPTYFVENQIIKLKRTPRFVQKFYTYDEFDEVVFFNQAKKALNRIRNEDWYTPPMMKSYFPNPFAHLCN